MLSDETKHERYVTRLLHVLPPSARRVFGWLIRPEAKWVRRPLSVALIVGGALGFLPVLGFWMLPAGALLLGEDIPFVRRTTIRALRGARYWCRRVWRWAKQES